VYSVDEGAVTEAVVARCQGGDFVGGTEALVRAWGPRLHAFLYRLAGRDEALAADAYMDACVAFLCGLESFDPARGPLRTWAFVVARNALHKRLRAERPHRHVGGSSALDRVVASARATTARFQRTEFKERVRRLQSALSPEDQALLALRVEERMSWAEIASVLGDPGEAPTRASARARKRFERAIAKLRELARADGLLSKEG
jgi:RNA polymerase sigma-70 factor, ECF subfamily